MRKLGFLTVALMLATVISTGCGPTYRMQQGAAVGAAIGAVVGHDIGEDSESTLIGAAVGGVAGAVAGDAIREYERCNYYGQCDGYQEQQNNDQRYDQRRRN